MKKGETQLALKATERLASELHKALRHGELFFRRVWWTGNRTTRTGNRTIRTGNRMSSRP